MVILKDETQLENYLEELAESAAGDRIFPLLIDRYIEGFEVEVDAVCDGADILIPGIFQHVERAGVHSGDSVAIFPAPDLTEEQKQLITAYTQKISKSLDIKGIMNIQFVLSEDRKTIYVLEVNPRASRTVPISSKITGVPMVDLATRVQMGEALKNQEWNLGLHNDVSFFAVKMPIFSTNKLPGLDPILGPEMKSTGEAIGIGSTVDQAMAKAFGWKEDYLKALTKKDVIYLSLPTIDDALLSQLKTVSAKIEADQKTADFLRENGVVIDQVTTIEEAEEKCMDDFYQLVSDTNRTGEKDGHVVLREATLKSDILCFTSTDTLTAYLQATNEKLEEPFSIQVHRKKQKDSNKKERVKW